MATFLDFFLVEIFAFLEVVSLDFLEVESHFSDFSALETLLTFGSFFVFLEVFAHASPAKNSDDKSAVREATIGSIKRFTH